MRYSLNLLCTAVLCAFLVLDGSIAYAQNTSTAPDAHAQKGQVQSAPRKPQEKPAGSAVKGKDDPKKEKPGRKPSKPQHTTDERTGGLFSTATPEHQKSTASQATASQVPQPTTHHSDPQPTISTHVPPAIGQSVLMDAQADSSISVSSISSGALSDGLAAANVLSSYYGVLLEHKGQVEGIRPIRHVLVYPVGNNEYSDYWGFLKFRYNDRGMLVDPTGYFEGYKVQSKEEIPKEGKLTDIGLYQKTEQTKEEMDGNYVSMKMLIDEISRNTKKDIQTLHNEKMQPVLMQGLAEYFQHNQDHKDTCMTVCICQDHTCQKPCKSIKCIEPMYLL